MIPRLDDRLGQANSATNQTQLSSTNASLPTLNVVNTGGRPAARFQANGGKAPFTVSNSTKIANLNADQLDGISADGLGRLALAANPTLFVNVTFAAHATATITVPQAGFVRVDGSVVAYAGFASTACSDCAVGLRVRDDGSGATSSEAFFQGGAAPNRTGTTLPVHWVFAASPGTHTYSLQGGVTTGAGGPYDLYNPVLVAQFVPYGGTGSPTSLGASHVQSEKRLTLVPVR